MTETFAYQENCLVVFHLSKSAMVDFTFCTYRVDKVSTRSAKAAFPEEEDWPAKNLVTVPHRKHL